MHRPDTTIRPPRNRRDDTRRSGVAAVEFALMLPVFAALLFLLVEGANAMHTYSQLQQASREGARLVLVQGDTDGVADVIRNLVPDLPTDALQTTVTTDVAQNTVTVRVELNYESFYGENPALQAFGGEEGYVFAAQTTMPLP